MSSLFGPVVAGVVGAALIVGGFTALEWRSGHRWWRRDDVGSDVLWTALTVVGVRQLGKVGVVVAAVVAGLALGAPPAALSGLRDFFSHRETFVAGLPLWLQIPIGLLIHDAAHYFAHRLFHRQRRLWPFHAVHHSAPRLDWFATLRGHPVNDALQRAMSVLPLLLLGFRPGVVAGVAPVVVFYGFLLHADVAWDFGPLRRVIASPRFHRWHHAALGELDDDARTGGGCNFAGLFPIFDVVFGTYFLPARAPLRTGVDDALPAQPLRQLWWSFARAFSR